MNLKILSASALVGACTLATGLNAQTPPTANSNTCAIHVYPADGVHSVGEDFDAIHGVDQDLRHYYSVAGQSLDWLTPARQLELLRGVPLSMLAGAGSGEPTLHGEAIRRSAALEPGPRTAEPGCLVELMVPQIMLERSGLSARSVRVFGVVRHYRAGVLQRQYNGYAAAPMTGFNLQSPSDALAATKIVETAYVQAVETVLRNSTKTTR